jgi:hypothetical protein
VCLYFIERQAAVQHLHIHEHCTRGVVSIPTLSHRDCIWNAHPVPLPLAGTAVADPGAELCPRSAPGGHQRCVANGMQDTPAPEDPFQQGVEQVLWGLQVALIGRPNVGKSALYNRLVGRREALVSSQPA